MKKTKTKKYYCNIDIKISKKASLSTPVRFTADFDRLCGGQLGRGLVDPHTIRVNRNLNGRIKKYNVQFDEMLYYQNQGWIAWLVDDKDAGGEWSIEFSIRGDKGELVDVPYMPIVGVGDEIFAQQKKQNPICVPGRHQFPIPVDFDGDGKIDIISTSHYSNTQGMPWSGVFFWKNIGTNEKPRFAPPMRISADGVDMTDPSRTHWQGKSEFASRHDFISEYYIRCDVFDWFGNGRNDLVTASRSGGIRVYRNKGTLDLAGVPEFELATKIPLPQCLAPASYLGFRVIDWDGSGRCSFLIGISYREESLEYGQLFLMRNIGGTLEKPKFQLQSLPVEHLCTPAFKHKKISMRDDDWKKHQNFSGFRTFAMDWFDIDGDGKKELIVLHASQRPEPMMEVWRNVGASDKPILRNEGKLPWCSKPHTYAFRFTKDAAFDGCIVAGTNAGSGMAYYKRMKDDPFDEKAFDYKGLLQGQGAKIQPEGYTRPWPVTDKDGKANLLFGDEGGYLSYSENKGTKEKPQYSWPRKVTDRKDNFLHFSRENILHDNNLEWCCGQLKPCVIDWDGDGKPDIIFSGNTNRIYWLRKFDAKNCSVSGTIELKVKGNPSPFAWRKGIAVIDFDGDGKPEMLAVNSQQEFCIYKQTKEPSVLVESQKLKFTNGKVITTNEIPPKIYRYPVVALFAYDYTGSGTYDLLVSSNYNTSLLENVGTNQKPFFKRPKLLKTPDGVISVGHHETQVMAADINGDGIDEIIIGGESGTIYVFHRDWLDCVNNKVLIKET